MTDRNDNMFREQIKERFNSFEVEPPKHVLDKIKNTVATENVAGSSSILKRSLIWFAAATIAVSVSYFFMYNNNSTQSPISETPNSTTQTITDNSTIKINKIQEPTIYINKRDKKESNTNYTKTHKLTAFAGDDRIICGLECTLNAKPNYKSSNGSWVAIDDNLKIINGIFTENNTNTPHAKIIVSEAGKYNFKWTETYNGKSASDVVSIEFVMLDKISVGKDKTICGKECEISTTGKNGFWSSPNIVSINNAQNTITQLNITKYGVYSVIWTEQKLNCKTTDTMVIHFNEIPTANIQLAETPNCNGGQFGLKSDYVPTNIYKWDFDDGVINKISAETYLVSWTKSDNHKIKLSVSNNNCVSNTEIILEEPLKINASFVNTQPNSEIPTMVYFTNKSTIGNEDYSLFTDIEYKWIFGDGESSNDENPEHLYLRSGIYTPMLIIKNSLQCVDTISGRTLNIFAGSNKKQSNYFTPNGDGINDVFKVNTASLQSFTCIILDQSGKKLHEWSNTADGWNGYLKSGNVASAGLYYYIIKGISFDNKPMEKPGVVYLVRE